MNSNSSSADLQDTITMSTSQDLAPTASTSTPPLPIMATTAPAGTTASQLATLLATFDQFPNLPDEVQVMIIRKAAPTNSDILHTLINFGNSCAEYEPHGGPNHDDLPVAVFTTSTPESAQFQEKIQNLIFVNSVFAKEIEKMFPCRLPTIQGSHIRINPDFTALKITNLVDLIPRQDDIDSPFSYRGHSDQIKRCPLKCYAFQKIKKFVVDASFMTRLRSVEAWNWDAMLTDIAAWGQLEVVIVEGNWGAAGVPTKRRIRKRWAEYEDDFRMEEGADEVYDEGGVGEEPAHTGPRWLFPRLAFADSYDFGVAASGLEGGRMSRFE